MGLQDVNMMLSLVATDGQELAVGGLEFEEANGRLGSGEELGALGFCRENAKQRLVIKAETELKGFGWKFRRDNTATGRHERC